MMNEEKLAFFSYQTTIGNFYLQLSVTHYSSRMRSFTAAINKFGQMGEKTGWTYLLVPQEIAQQIKPDTKKSFRVKGKLNSVAINSVALMPMGGGDFILVLNAGMRKQLKQPVGSTLAVQLEEDTSPLTLPEDLLECLKDEPVAKAHLDALPPSHQQYYGRWITAAKTEATRTKRIAQTITALAKNQDYGAMIRESKKQA